MEKRALPSLPDSDRFGGPGWLARTGGVMSKTECAHGLAVATTQQTRNLWERLTPWIDRAASLANLAPVPDSRLVAIAEEAALEQNSELLAHGYRSAIFGRALAHIDKQRVDLELLHICGLLHDVGLMKAVVGEDFTVRSAAVAQRCACEAGEEPEVGVHLADALIVHTTVGVSPQRDGALGAYTQFGAMVDLVGLRLSHLPREFVRSVLQDHPRGNFKREILGRLEKEANSVRGGRFAFAQRVGFGIAVRHSPFST